MSNKRELRIEINTEYNVCEWNMANLIEDIRHVANEHLGTPNISITDETVDDTPSKMYCPHCNGVISGIVFKKEK